MRKLTADQLHRALVVCLLVGIAFSCYAAYESLVPSAQGSCDINSYIQCHKVDVSSYSHLGPLPDWALGIGGFVAMLLVEVLLLRTYEPRYLRLLLLLSIVGLGISAVLGSIEVFVIGAFCPVCLGAYLSNVGVFGTAFGLHRARGRAKDPEETDSVSPEGPEPTSTMNPAS